MGNLNEQAVWESGVPYFEANAVLTGGPDCPDNIPIRALANRTLFLKALVEVISGSTDPLPQYWNDARGNAEVAAAIAAVVGSSPETLNQINELAAAIANDPNFAVTMATELAKKANLSGAAFTGPVSGPTAVIGDASTLLATTAFVAALVASRTGSAGAVNFRNKLINGNFDFWQRGTSIAAGTGSRYCADRWVSNSSGSTIAVSRQTFAPGQTLVPSEPTYFQRVVVASVAGANNQATIAQPIESVRSCAGRKVTRSFWAKADAAKSIAVEFAQNFGSGGSPTVTGIGAQKIALTTNWTYYTITADIPSIAGKTIAGGDDYLAMFFWCDAGSSFDGRTASLGQQSIVLDLAQVQLEVGAVATSSEERPAQVELALCQRYFQKTYHQNTVPANGAGGGLAFGLVANCYAGQAGSNSQPMAVWQFDVEMRATPTITLYNPSPTNSGAGGQWRNGSNDASTANASAYGMTTRKTNVYNSDVAVAASTWYIHAAADAEL
ncbi:hypothetical protein R0381_003665 [Jeongeupia wiesaeckerbachi]|uniref:hypothetical protein n=1 Tax=Jeongeupia wiesaeckerbachi TaxID=3051218 RepID=UPI003D809500